MLDPTGFSREEADAVVGKQIVRVFERASGQKIDGRSGRIVAAEQIPEFHGNNYQFFVAVQWNNRDGTRSKPTRLSKEQLEQCTRPLRIQEIAAAQNRQGVAAAQNQTRRQQRGFSM
jgi:hypothetical protein